MVPKRKIHQKRLNAMKMMKMVRMNLLQSEPSLNPRPWWIRPNQIWMKLILNVKNWMLMEKSIILKFVRGTSPVSELFWRWLWIILFLQLCQIGQKNLIHWFSQKNGMEYLKREDADIVALQETKCETKKIPDEAKLEGYTRYFLDSMLKILFIFCITFPWAVLKLCNIWTFR